MNVKEFVDRGMKASALGALLFFFVSMVFFSTQTGLCASFGFPIIIKKSCLDVEFYNPWLLFGNLVLWWGIAFGIIRFFKRTPFTH